ncbi:hypothetical protein Tco_0800745 [Tanacetum coccineum]|uniref:Uncharacterized protein n=1 Tax=Tanacetum coccineum TaxID=301880 RepID=A0ABQ4ZY38_9ASTR
MKDMSNNKFLSFTALLTVEDDEFWLDISPVEFRELPALQDAVTVVGEQLVQDSSKYNDVESLFEQAR